MKKEQLDRIYEHFLRKPVISTDSRKVLPGSIFFALKGPTFNGNQFAASALDQGASMAIVDEEDFACDDRFILVEDVLTALQELATFHRRQFDIPVIAITGTNGKTTTKELVHAVLSTTFRVTATSGNLNNHIGVPLTLLSITKDTGIAVVEMGANHPGEIDQLCRIAEPGYGLITNIGKAHLEGFGGFEGVVRTKTELYRYLAATGGKIFLNSDDNLLNEHAANLPVITYGSTSSFVSCKDFVADPFVKLTLILQEKEKIRVDSRLYGGYNLPNVMAAAGVGHHFKVPAAKIAEAIAGYQPTLNRSQVKETGRNTLIMDAYNANPSSMREALITLAGTSYHRKVLVLGDMLELGKESDTEHEGILALAENLNFQEVYLVGPVFTRVNRKREFLCFQDVDLAGMWFGHHPLNEAVILLKGSRGMKLEKLVELF